MAETLGASFSIDVTNLKAGLAQANRLIRESESEFKAAAAGMDNWAQSEDGLNAKIASLNQITELQRKKVDALQNEYDNLIANGLDPTSKQAVELRTKINNETAALNKNETELRKQTKALEELSNETDNAGKEAEDAAEGFTVLKGAAADLVAEGVTRLIDSGKQAITTLLSLSEETQELRENMSKLKTSFESAKLSVDDAKRTYTELYSIMGDEGAATEAAQQLAKISYSQKDLEANTRILTGVMAEYGASIPLEGLAEGIAASAKMKSVQGVLADALEWQSVNLDDFNKKLENLATEEERSALIQKELTKLYGKSADAYKENNAGIIASRKATAEYNETLAELGEAIEPVNVEITEIKTELAKEFVPVVKNQVAPAIKDFTKSLKDSGALKDAGKAIGYLAENFDDLVTVTLTAVTVYKTFSAAMAVSTAITATKTAVAGLAAGVGTATKLQTGWNAAMSANPIGAVLTAVGLLTAGVVLLAEKTKASAEAADLLTDSQRETVTAAKEAADAFRDTTQAAADMAAAGNAQIDNAQKLWRELQTLTTTNGEVQESDKARAEFILGELNTALGTEYSMTGNIINNYKNMVSSIEQVIETKRAQILLEAYEESYAEAIKNVAAAESSRAIQAQELAAQEKVYEEARTTALNARKNLEDKVANAKTEAELRALQGTANYVASLESAAEKEKGILEKKQGEYVKSDATVKDYYDKINSYETASTLVLEGETNKAIGHLNKYGSGFQTAASVAEKSKDEQINILRDQVVNSEIQLGLLEADYANSQSNMTEEEKKQAELRIANARKEAEDAKAEFAKVGGDMVKGLKKGAEDNEWELTGSLKKIVESGLEAAKKALGIKSPSRRFRDEVAKPTMQGWGGGIKKYKNLVLNELETVSNETLKSELYYLDEKERIEKEKAEKEYNERIANAKDAAEVEKIKQEQIKKEAEAAQQKYLEDLKKTAEKEKQLREEKKNAVLQQLEEEQKAFEDYANSILQARENVVVKLYDDANDKFVTTTFRSGNGVETYYNLPDLKGENEKLEQYSSLLDDLIEKYGALPEEIIDNLAGMTVDDGIKYVTAMLNASETAWNEYVAGFADRFDISNKIGQALFPDAAIDGLKLKTETFVQATSLMLDSVLEDTALSVEESLTKITDAAERLLAYANGTGTSIRKNNGGTTVNLYNYYQQAFSSRFEQYKSYQNLKATVRQAVAGG